MYASQGGLSRRLQDSVVARSTHLMPRPLPLGTVPTASPPSCPLTLTPVPAPPLAAAGERQ